MNDGYLIPQLSPLPMDKFGRSRDVVLGYDDLTMLLTDPAHPVFNVIVGRYANRIKDGTFSIPITKDPLPDGPFHIPTNDHSGKLNPDRRNWTIIERTATRVPYKHFDAADEGFPGNATTTHTVESGATLRTMVHASVTTLTPVMTTQHIY
ncbi:hypothetical protein ACEPAI_3479 [Sanghuangporus weigelae]